MKTDPQLAVSKHFRLQKVADGVYAAIHIDGGAAIGSAGILDLGDRTLVYDTFMAPQAAEDLRTAAEAIDGRPIDAVINSHWHNDHIWGNQIFMTGVPTLRRLPHPQTPQFALTDRRTAKPVQPVRPGPTRPPIPQSLQHVVSTILYASLRAHILCVLSSLAKNANARYTTFNQRPADLVAPGA